MKSLFNFYLELYIEGKNDITACTSMVYEVKDDITACIVMVYGG